MTFVNMVHICFVHAYFKCSHLFAYISKLANVVNTIFYN